MNIVPFVMLVSSSFTEEKTLLTTGYNFWPTKFSAYSYEWMFLTNASKIFTSYGITFFITIFGTVLSLLIGPLLAYPLSRRDFPRARLFTFIVFFTMIFNGGVVPSYIMWTQVFHIKNTIWALIFPESPSPSVVRAASSCSVIENGRFSCGVSVTVASLIVHGCRLARAAALRRPDAASTDQRQIAFGCLL